jgi:LPXTG-site transpeptidase (sortase) family protein
MGSSRSTRTAATVLAVAAVTAVGTSVVLASQQNASEVVVGFRTPASQPADSTQSRSPRETRPSQLDSDLDPDGRAAAATPPPRRLRVPSIGTDAVVLPTGVTPRGDAEIPRSGDAVGWYRFGALPGDARGSAVLIGHRDTDAEGPGELFDLDEVKAGEPVSVTSARGTLRYEVVSLRSITKAALPDALFRRGGQHRLVLITCGGPYLPEAGGYQENLVAIAKPVSTRIGSRP